MKKYERPIACIVDITSINIIATSGLKYTEENADNDFAILSNKHRGEWGNLWKK